MDKEKLFNENINFAYSIANKYMNYFLEIEDIRQQALIGLWKAAMIYDESKGCKFITLANTVIRNSINMYLRSIKKHIENDISIYTKLDNDELTLQDIIRDKKDLIDELEDNMDAQKLLSKISDTRYRFVIEENVIKDKKIQDIATDMNLTNQRISNIKFRGLKELRKKVEIEC